MVLWQGKLACIQVQHSAGCGATCPNKDASQLPRQSWRLSCSALKCMPQVREAIVGIFRERRNLAVQLKDTKSVVGRLKAVLLVLLHLLAAFFYLVIYNVSARQGNGVDEPDVRMHMCTCVVWALRYIGII